MNIRTKNIIATLLLIIAIFLASYYLFLQFIAHIESNLIKKQINITYNLGKNLEYYLDNAQRHLQSIALHLKSYDNLKSKEILNKLKTLAEYNSNIDLTYIIDREGKVILTYPRTNFKGTDNFSDHNWFKEVIKGTSYISGSIISDYNQNQIIFIAVPIKNRNNKIQGVIGVNIPLKELDDFITYNIKKKEYILFDNKERILAFEAPQNFLIPTNIGKRINKKELKTMAKKTKITSSQHLNYHLYSQDAYINSNNKLNEEKFKIINEELVTHYQLKNSDWHLYLRDNYKDMLYKLNHLEKKFIMFIIIISSLFLLWIIYNSQKISGPIDDLIRNSEKVAKGEYSKMNKDYPGELSKLAVAFNEMVEKVKRREKRLEKMFLDTIDSLVNLVEIKDNYTGNHSIKVRGFAISIAKIIGIDDKGFLKRVAIAGSIHDIGKIGISENILNKSGALTDKEFAEIKKHPIIGSKALEPFEYLKEIRKIIYHHHEHFDGDGYPEGIKGEEIPLEARIIAGADALHAMIEDRPYRQKLDIGTIKDIFRKEKGKQFDPQVAEATLKLIEELN